MQLHRLSVWSDSSAASRRPTLGYLCLLFAMLVLLCERSPALWAQGLRPAVVTTTASTGFTGANSIAVDAAGNLYIASGGTGSLIEIPAGGGAPITLVSGMSYPRAAAVDSAGYAYVGNYNGNIYKVPTGGGPAVDLLANNGTSNCSPTVQYYIAPLSIAVDGSNNVYFVGGSGTGPPPNTSGQAVYMISPAGACSIVVSSTTLGGATPTHVAADAAGNVSYSIGSTLYTLPTGASTPITVAAFGSDIGGLRADKFGNVFVTQASSIEEVPFSGGVLNGQKALTVLNSTSSWDIGVDANGVLYTTDTASIFETTVGNIWAVSANGQLARLNEAGDAVTTGAGTGSGASTLGSVAFDATGNVWSVTQAANTLNFVSRVGDGAVTYSGGGLSAPVSIAIDGQNFVWIANSAGNSLSVFDSYSGIAQSGTGGYASASVSTPVAIAIDGTGGVWVANKSTNTVTHLLGSALPVVVPMATAVAAGTLGVEP